MLIQHILVIQDDPELREPLVGFLDDIGYQVTVTEDAGTGLVVLRSTLHPLVVILDPAMLSGSLTGIDFLQAVVDDPELTAEHIFIFCSHFRVAPIMCDAIAALSARLPLRIETIKLPICRQEVLTAVVWAQYPYWGWD